MADIIKAACVQMTSGPDIEENLKQAEGFIREAAGKGAELIVTPEVTDHMLQKSKENKQKIHDQDNHTGVSFFSDLANELSITLIIGSMLIKEYEEKFAGRSFLFQPDGDLQTTYDKIHLYDVDLPNGIKWTESADVIPGNKAVVGKHEDINVGMTICYDLRFPHLYRDLALKGAEIIVVPSAFMVYTGEKQHWEVLLRARAIETGTFIIAPDQCGEHPGVKTSYGHSMIIDPFGKILIKAGEEPGIIVADLDMSLVGQARQMSPNLKCDQQYAV